VIRRELANLALRAAGWKFETAVPTLAKYVIVAAPHTSNWDGVVMMVMGQALELPMAFMIKDDWLKGPMGPPMRRMGAVAINRSRKTNVVDQMIEELGRRDRLALVIPPEGTRKRAELWRSGFYHIARGAQVPVVPAYVDAPRKRVGMGEPIWLTGDVGADMDQIRAFYAAKKPVGFDANSFGPIRLREELSAAEREALEQAERAAKAAKGKR
jgi:1-acyl-sn-glycerol-3-phosphate acyltransferase